MTQTSRRNLLMALAGLTTAAAAAPVVQALPIPVEASPQPVLPRSTDPVFAAMERWTRLEVIALDLERTEFGAAAVLDARRARLMLAQTAPTTREGLTALTEFVARQSRELDTRGSWFFFEVGDEANAYAKSIARAAALLEAEERADPIFALIERHRRAFDACEFAGRYADEVDELYAGPVGEAKAAEAHAAMAAAEAALIGTGATTAEGWAALADYGAEMTSLGYDFLHLPNGESLSKALHRRLPGGIARPPQKTGRAPAVFGADPPIAGQSPALISSASFQGHAHGGGISLSR